MSARKAKSPSSAAVAADVAVPVAVPSDDHFPILLSHVQGRFGAVTLGDSPLFTTKPPRPPREAREPKGDDPGCTADPGEPSYFDHYLALLPPAERQSHNCHCCRRFINTYGGLVTINADGVQIPVLWGPAAPAPFSKAVKRIYDLVSKAKVDGVFVTHDARLGVERNPDERKGHPRRDWFHLFVDLPPALVARRTLKQTAGQIAAEKRQEHDMLARALGEYDADVVARAAALLESGQLYRAEKALDAARWLNTLHVARKAAKAAVLRENLTWLYAAKAPAGWCHVKAGMIGTLLDDLTAGKEFADVKRSWDSKMDPQFYRRPQAPPKVGNILAAEKLVERLGIAASLKRRFCNRDDVAVKLWERPAQKPTEKDGSVFGHLLPKASAAEPMPTGALRMTWRKFAETVLARAERIEFLPSPHAASYAALVTAQDQDAPPILQWDYEDARNPVSHYVYIKGSYPDNWGLRTGYWVDCWAIAPRPAHWNRERPATNQAEAVFFLLEGARDQRHIAGATGGGLFVETLKSELNEARATIEAHVQATTIAGAAQAGACGVMLSTSDTNVSPLTFRVTGNGLVTIYQIDRFD